MDPNRVESGRYGDGSHFESCPAATGEARCTQFPDGAHRCSQGRDHMTSSALPADARTHICTCGYEWSSLSGSIGGFLETVYRPAEALTQRLMPEYADSSRSAHKSHYGASKHDRSHVGYPCPRRDWTGEPYLPCEEAWAVGAEESRSPDYGARVPDRTGAYSDMCSQLPSCREGEHSESCEVSIYRAQNLDYGPADGERCCRDCGHSKAVPARAGCQTPEEHQSPESLQADQHTYETAAAPGVSYFPYQMDVVGENGRRLIAHWSPDGLYVGGCLIASQKDAAALAAFVTRESDE